MHAKGTPRGDFPMDNDRLLRRYMGIFHEPSRGIRTNRNQCHVYRREPRPDLLEMYRVISSVTGEPETESVHGHHPGRPECLIAVIQTPCRPVMGGCGSNLEAGLGELFPPIQFDDPC